MFGWVIALRGRWLNGLSSPHLQNLTPPHTHLLRVQSPQHQTWWVPSRNVSEMQECPGLLPGSVGEERWRPRVAEAK